MRDLFDAAWHRFNVILGVVADANARTISILFYFTILVPFALVSILFTDPLQKKRAAGSNAGKAWVERDAIPTTIESAREQG